jgi:hypothetical protein
MFETVPSEGHRCNLTHNFNRERRERDKGMKGMEKKERDE